MNLGLSQIDAQVYVFLANKGPQKKEKIAEELKLQELPIYQSLESLRSKGVVNSTHEHSVLFYALPFNKALEQLVKEHLKEAQVVEQNKDEILSKLHTVVKDSTS